MEDIIIFWNMVVYCCGRSDGLTKPTHDTYSECRMKCRELELLFFIGNPPEDIKKKQIREKKNSATRHYLHITHLLIDERRNTDAPRHLPACMIIFSSIDAPRVVL